MTTLATPKFAGWFAPLLGAGVGAAAGGALGNSGMLDGAVDPAANALNRPIPTGNLVDVPPVTAAPGSHESFMAHPQISTADAIRQRPGFEGVSDSGILDDSNFTPVELSNAQASAQRGLDAADTAQATTARGNALGEHWMSHARNAVSEYSNANEAPLIAAHDTRVRELATQGGAAAGGLLGAGLGAVGSMPRKQARLEDTDDMLATAHFTKRAGFMRMAPAVAGAGLGAVAGSIGLPMAADVMSPIGHLEQMVSNSGNPQLEHDMGQLLDARDHRLSAAGTALGGGAGALLGRRVGVEAETAMGNEGRPDMRAMFSPMGR